MSTKEPWYDSDDPTRVVRGAGWRIGVGILVATIVVAVIGGIAWGIGVITSGPAGAGNVIKQNNSSQNRIDQQAYFEQLNGDIIADAKKLKTAIAVLQSDPADFSFNLTNYTGLLNNCQQGVADYNAASGKTLFTSWKTADLPESIDVDTACPTATDSQLKAPGQK